MAAAVCCAFLTCVFFCFPITSGACYLVEGSRVAKVLRILAAIGSLSIAFQESIEVRCLGAWMDGRTDRWTDTQIHTWIDIA